MNSHMRIRHLSAWTISKWNFCTFRASMVLMKENIWNQSLFFFDLFIPEFITLFSRNYKINNNSTKSCLNEFRSARMKLFVVTAFWRIGWKNYKIDDEFFKNRHCAFDPTSCQRFSLMIKRVRAISKQMVCTIKHLIYWHALRIYIIYRMLRKHILMRM